jgi:hypothetical protein
MHRSKAYCRGAMMRRFRTLGNAMRMSATDVSVMNTSRSRKLPTTVMTA